MIAIILLVAYIVVGSIFTVLATYVSSFFDSDCDSDLLMLFFVVFWPITSFPMFVYGLTRKVLDFLFKD